MLILHIIIKSSSQLNVTNKLAIMKLRPWKQWPGLGLTSATAMIVRRHDEEGLRP